MSQLQTIKSKNLSWINIVNASSKELDYLKKNFKFDDFDLNDSYAHSHAQRPKINIRSNYFFIVLLFPVYNRKTREITPAELDIFITQNHLITIHYNQLTHLNDLFKTCQDNEAQRATYFKESPALILYEILDRLYISQFPMLDHISLDINNIEKNIFAGKEREMVQEILVIKRNIVYFRKIIQIHGYILNKIMENLKMFIKNNNRINDRFNDLLDHIQNIWDLSDSYQQTINALEDTNSALVSFKLNDIMRTLTIFSVIVFPLTLMAAIFGMNVTHMPFAGSEFDFWKIVAIMAVASLGMFAYFKHKKWI